jgi:hypothetical protein
MAHPLLPSNPFAAVPTVVGSSLSELVGRAAAILTRETSPLSSGPSSPRFESVPSSALEFPWCRADRAAPAGTSASVSLRLENLETYPVAMTFCSSNLLNNDGAQIPASAISFAPARLNVGAREQGVVTVDIAIPQTSAPGSYSGLVQVTGLSGVKAVITIDVR